MSRLGGKVAIVTGGARGIGAAVVRAFVAEGARVVVGDLDEAGAVALTDELGEAAVAFGLDVANDAGWERAVALAVERFGGIDVLVNNAGGAPMGVIEEQPRAEYERVIAVNQTGVWLGIKAVTPSMRAGGGGSIVNVSSAVGAFGAPGLAAYSAAKFAIRGLTRTAALELASDAIRVNAVLPGLIETPATEPSGAAETIARDGEFARMTVPLHRIGAPSEVAALVLFLASDESSYCTGADYLVDGGMLAGPPPT